MPELPEVETVRRGLEPLIVGKTIKLIHFNRADLRFSLPTELKSLRGERITALERRAKFLGIAFGTRGICISHLGMTGRFRIEGLENIAEAAHIHPVQILTDHDHVVFEFSDASKLIYNDVRRFGFMEWHEGDLSTYPRLSGYGPEPNSNTFTSNYLWNACKASAAPLKSILLNQKIIAGLGNIYVCEALFIAKLHPAKTGKTLTKTQASKLAEAINIVIEKAISAGGSTLRDFAHADGSAGYFQHEFAVYGRENTPCPSCRSPIERLIQSNRSSFFCAQCQKYT